MSALAIDGGTPVRTAGWPAWPDVSEAEWTSRVEPRLRQVYLSRQEGLPNPQSAAFEEAFGAYIGVEHALLTSHGTDALMCLVAGALDVDGIGDGGEVICPEYTFIASASAPLAMGCSIAFCDIDRETFNLSPAAVEAAITERTVGIMAVHLGGMACDMDALRQIAERHGLALMEDCAQAHGAEHHGRHVGGLGHGGAFSFQSSKNLCSGEGGMVTTNDPNVYRLAFAYRNIGRFPGGERWEHPVLGGNYRCSEYLAALLSARLETFDEQANRRDANGRYLNELLAGIEGVTPPVRMPWCTRHAYHLYMCHYDPDAFGGHSRAEFVRALSAEGIACGAGYAMPLSQQESLRMVAEKHPGRIRVEPAPNTAWVIEHAFWFTQNQLLADRAAMDDIATAIAKIQAAWTA